MDGMVVLLPVEMGEGKGKGSAIAECKQMVRMVGINV